MRASDKNSMESVYGTTYLSCLQPVRLDRGHNHYMKDQEQHSDAQNDDKVADEVFIVDVVAVFDRNSPDGNPYVDPSLQRRGMTRRSEIDEPN